MGTTSFARGALLLLAAAFPFMAPAPLKAGETPLSLRQALEYSIQNNGDLVSFRREAGIYDAAGYRAGLLPNPTLDLEAGTGALTGSSNENSFAIGLSQEFPMAGKRQKRVDTARMQQEAYHWQLADRERLLRRDLKAAFHELQLANRRNDLAQQAIDLNRQLLDVAGERLAAGDIPELEMNLVKVELARSEGARINCMNEVVRSLSKLADLMGLPPEEQPSVVRTTESGKPLEIPLADMKRLAIDNRPDLKALAAEKEKGDAEMELARAEGIPDITAGIALRRDSTAMEIGGVEGRDTAYTIGLRLSLPIPLFNRNEAGVMEAGARRNGSERRLMAAKSSIAREVESAWSAYNSSEKVLALYRTDVIPQLEENLNLTREAYRLGEVGILAVIREQKNFFEISEGYLAAQHDRQIALISLEAAVATELNGGAE